MPDLSWQCSGRPFLATVRDKDRAVGEHAKTVLSKVMGLPARHDAIDHTPMQNIGPITCRPLWTSGIRLADAAYAAEAGRAAAVSGAQRKPVERRVPIAARKAAGQVEHER